jgi:GH24 family phage-related lysozyme (muramidase)
VNIEQLRSEIEADEGNIGEIYLDHLGLPTFGIGHLVKKTDPENGMQLVHL